MGAHSFSDLIPHVRHKIQCVYYGGSSKEDAQNASVECATCNEVLIDFDRDEEKPIKQKAPKEKVYAIELAGGDWVKVIVRDGKIGEISTSLHGDHENGDRPDAYDAAIDGLESTVLALACAGIDVSDPKYVEGLQGAIDAIGTNLG
jgi:hypothetical protein